MGNPIKRPVIFSVAPRPTHGLRASEPSLTGGVGRQINDWDDPAYVPAAWVWGASTRDATDKRFGGLRQRVSQPPSDRVHVATILVRADDDWPVVSMSRMVSCTIHST
jgi:hypothetical protein